MILLIAQIIVSVLLITVILLQQGGAGLGSAFGGSGESYSKKRGFQKQLFWSSVVLATLFIVLGILNLVV